jgi:four helix bundle protein
MTTCYAKSFKELRVYQKAREVSQTVFRLSKVFPKEETYSLTDQMRRAARSVGAQIAEAWGKRRYEKHFVSKLTDADAEQMETQHWCKLWTAVTSLLLTPRIELRSGRNRPDVELYDRKAGSFSAPSIQLSMNPPLSISHPPTNQEPITDY